MEKPSLRTDHHSYLVVRVVRAVSCQVDPPVHLSMAPMWDSTALEFGLIQILQSGDTIADAVVCVLVPMLIQQFRSSLYSFRYQSARQRRALPSSTASVSWIRCLTGSKSSTIHTIEFSQFASRSEKVLRGEEKERMRNFILHKAFAVFLAKHLDVRQQQHARYELVQASATSDAAKILAEAKQELGLLRVGALPPLRQWVRLDHEIEVMQDEQPFDPTLREKIQEEKWLFHLRLTSQKALERMHTMLHDVYMEFQAQEAKQQGNDSTRYLYCMQPTDDPKTKTYKRYALGDDKTFATLFFDEKPQILQLLRDFQARQGKFAVSGFPYKLGLLLHGPPGTGKTSLIKAIAQYTNRHIVTIQLSKIKTNQELMDALFDLKFNVTGVDLPVRLKCKDVVFVIEDVDCCSDVVMARCSDNTKEKPAPKSEQLMTALLHQYQAIRRGGLIGSTTSLASDKLTLSGLLNVLDGVVDCPGRILIMTTNHPEKLDPALIRPGRVNRKVLLGPLSLQSMHSMLEYYFATSLTSSQREQLAKVAKTYTPAEIEALCAEYETVDELLEDLIL